MTTSPVIELDAVGMTYRSRKETNTVLDGCTLTVGRGEFVSIVGHSGGGKTTLLRIISGLIHPTEGSVRVNGQHVDQSLSDMSMVFQKPVLLPWRDNLQNVLLPMEFRGRVTDTMRAYAMELLEMTGLKDTARRHPYELSGGMQQRVAICRALVSHPDIMLMDEPFGALDAMTRDSMNLELQRIWSETGRSILFVTHSIPEAVFLSDRVLVIGDKPGRVVADITVDLPRPRTKAHRYTPEFYEYEQQISELIGAKESIA
ncbi:ABC transporter ATP-binding protein [Acrocarpospora pleiomorpha]|uniref:ABC transporter ATP-binding protein n=1 Tax=Acrocarpospora pleiomorpha TaxID=90975 RepID=A0A5M3Y193_9ACTN|nr:ABC transporter ATP-binding protein [Acrocarpospora pleiomorpha]GES27044.1 ABC transporter ATP-binding protein [Acrocarpospora pleiomorpha]